jgi:hypothetical protein
MLERAIETCLQYGAIGVLALAFLATLWLYIRADKRSQEYADRLGEASMDRTQLIQVVSENTRGYVMLSERLAQFAQSQQATANVLSRLDARLENGRCPFLQEKANP